MYKSKADGADRESLNTPDPYEVLRNQDRAPAETSVLYEFDSLEISQPDEPDQNFNSQNYPMASGSQYLSRRGLSDPVYQQNISTHSGPDLMYGESAVMNPISNSYEAMQYLGSRDRNSDTPYSDILSLQDESYSQASSQSDPNSNCQPNLGTYDSDQGMAWQNLPAASNFQHSGPYDRSNVEEDQAFTGLLFKKKNDTRDYDVDNPISSREDFLNFIGNKERAKGYISDVLSQAVAVHGGSDSFSQKQVNKNIEALKSFIQSPDDLEILFSKLDAKEGYRVIGALGDQYLSEFVNHGNRESLVGIMSSTLYEKISNLKGCYYIRSLCHSDEEGPDSNMNNVNVETYNRPGMDRNY